MCGRYVSTRRPQDLVDQFDVTRWDPGQVLGPSWNVAPTDEVWSVLERVEHDTGEVTRQLRSLRWGLVPSWAKSLSIGAKMINARVETVAEKPAYRRAFAKRRCLLPADGFYEWQAVAATETAKARKQPYFISSEDGQVMAFAGLYEFWRAPDVSDTANASDASEADAPGAWWTTCTIITTEATDAAGRVHPRMPLTIAPDDWSAWLDPAHEDPGELRALLTAPAAGRLAARAVSTAVNDVRNNGPHLLDEITDASSNG
ncbi:SOS response-associated peptidase [Streptomyces sp. CA2R101]|uniref:SOS response-associated peptidase n=1 Tax=Streptomyces sp. CA2R101 TaxID=3120152 RepID=UPI00300B55BD